MAAATTIYKLSEEILKMLSGGTIQASTNITFNEIKISIGQVANSLLKIEHFSVNEKLGEKIPNGSVIGTYDGIIPVSYVTGRSKATLPIKPIKLPRNMGVYSVYLTLNPYDEFIPLQMGQMNLLCSQPLINDLMGQTGYENFGMDLIFNKDLPLLFNGQTISMRLAILDISLYSDFDPLPILPEQEWQIKQEVIKLYSQIGTADMVVDPTAKFNQGLPIKQQEQS